MITLSPTMRNPMSRKIKSTPRTQLEHNCNLDVDNLAMDVRMTTIVCTIGPACANLESLLKMISSGMNIARLNFSHGTHEYHAESIRLIREATLLTKNKVGTYRPVAIALDTKGPEIRTGIFNGDFKVEVTCNKGDIVSITNDEKYKDNQQKDVIWVDYKNIVNVLNVGKRIYIDDGLISLRVLEVNEDSLKCKVESGGIIGSKKGVNLPQTPTGLPPVSEQDVRDLCFAAEQGIDIVFASFIRNAGCVHEIRDILGESGKRILIISKVENQEGLENFDDILEASDGIMVARGDLGIEIPPEKVFMAQKMMIAKCNRVGKPVICATQMLESMTYKSRPTRAEASDVANAVLDGADCVMLSGETAKGKYPVECVELMALICREAEASIFHNKTFEELRSSAMLFEMNHTLATALSAVEASFNVEAPAIVVLSKSGRSAAYIAQFRPKCVILAVSRNAQVARQLHLYRSVIPIIYEEPEYSTEDWTIDVETRVNFACNLGLKQGFILKGQYVVVTTGWKAGTGYTNTVRIHRVQ